MAHIVLPAVDCLYSQLWLTLNCQWQIAYLLSYGSHCIAPSGRLLDCSAMAHIVFPQWQIACLLSYDSHCIASGRLLASQL